MTTKELLISCLNLLSEEDIAALLDAATHMEEKMLWQLNRTALIAVPILSSAMGINAGSKGFTVNLVERHSFRLLIPLCRTPISQRKRGAKS